MRTCFREYNPFLSNNEYSFVFALNAPPTDRHFSGSACVTVRGNRIYGFKFSKMNGVIINNPHTGKERNSIDTAHDGAHAKYILIRQHAISLEGGHLPASRILCLTECCLPCQNCHALISSSGLFSSLNISMTTLWKQKANDEFF